MIKSKHAGLLVFAFVLIVGEPASGGDKQQLQYRMSSGPHKILGENYIPKTLTLTREIPQGIIPPDFKSNDPFFAFVSLPLAKTGHVWLALDRDSVDGAFNMLWVDSNGNGSLKDESPSKALISSKSCAFFAPFRFDFDRDDGQVSYHLNFAFDIVDDSPRLVAKSGGWYEGYVQVAGRERYCLLLDNNHNGTFNDMSIDFAQSDLIRIGDTKGWDTCLVGQYIEVDDQLYSLEVARDGAFIELGDASGARLGVLRPPDGAIEFTVGGKTGMFDRKPAGGSVQVPAGQYRMYGWTVERKDEQGGLWKAKAHSLGTPDIINVAEDRESVLSFGERLVADVTARKEKEDYTFTLRLEGEMGETIRLTENGNSVTGGVLVRNADRTYEKILTQEFG